MSYKYKKLLFIGILSILALIFIPNESKAVTYTDSETGITWNYAVIGGNATNVYIDSYPESLETLTIPESINGSPVTVIRGGNTNLNDTRQNILKSSSSNTTIKQVILPSTLTTIGRNTFANFHGITSIVIPDSVTSILESAFYSCTELKEITLPVTSGFYKQDKYVSNDEKNAAFYNCPSIETINLTKGKTGILPDQNSYSYKYAPWLDMAYTSRTKKTINILDGITKIGDRTFYQGSLIEKVTIPDSVKEIGNYAFYGNQVLSTINLPDSIEKIGDYAFFNCSKLNVNDLALPNNLNSLGRYSFQNCINIKGKLTIPDGITVIPNYAFSTCTSITEVEMGNNVTEIGNNAFEMCKEIKSIKLSDNLTTIKEKAFYQCAGLNELVLPETLTIIEKSAFFQCINLSGDLVIPDNVTTIGENAFQSNIGLNGKLVLGSKVSSIGKDAFSDCINFKEVEIKDGKFTEIPAGLFKNWKSLTTVKYGDKITSIGKKAFEGCTSLKELPLTENITTIGDEAFIDCTGLEGDITIPDTITKIGTRAFFGCDGINGVLTLGKGIDKIESFTFYGCPNIKKFVIPSEVKTIERFALYGISEIYYLGEEEELNVSATACGGNAPFIHYKNCIHKLAIDIPEGYEIINKETNEVLQPGEYNCETNLKIGLRVKPGYQINNDLKLVISKQGKYKGSENIEEKLSLANFDVYEISSFNRDYTISIKDTSVTTDLALRTYIHQVNYNDLEVSRIPSAKNESGIISYNHTKKPVEVNKGDLITFKIRVYNEGNKPGIVNEISKYLPEGLSLANSETNRRYGWVQGENGKVSTRYFENKTISAYAGGVNIPYEEISLICRVTSQGATDADTRLVTIAEISEGGTKDTDSTYGQITSNVDSTYKLEEANASTENSYVRNDDDDTDFENVIIHPTLPVEYTIKITKIDTDTNELLAGAVFNLKDTEGNIVSTATTDENGNLSFGLITSYGEGTDIYYIEEALAPEGYMLTEKATIEVNVTKTLKDEVLGSYNLKVVCQTLNYSTDITRYDYIPVATAKDLQKVGSGETIKYEDVEYLCTETANYRLVNDIDLDGIAWKPIDKKVAGIFDGNGHSIKNLTIVSDKDYTYSEVGLFRYFSGIVQGLNLENVNIVVPGMVAEEELETITGKTCVGGFAGFMEKGTVKSCSISGTINAGCYNVGGFVGHSAENNIIKFQNCTNSAKIIATSEENYGGYNIGGLIGCAVGSLSLNDCLNEGEIEAFDTNVGGLVGFVQSTGYEEVAIKAGYTEDDKTITLLVGNSKTKGKYDIILENRDVKTLGFIAGAKYSVYDSKLQQISGYEEIQLNSGKLKVATVDINYVGIDTYYIKEVEPAPGYERLKSYVKLVVSRYWDAESSSFRVEVNAENIVDDKIDEEEKKENTYKELESLTGSVNTNVTFEGIGWNNDKVAFIDCTNKGELKGYKNVGGILGTAYCKVQMNRCNNLGTITAEGQGKSGGIIAEVTKTNNDNLVEIQNCINEGEIYSLGGTASAAGIISESVSNIKVINCVNKGKVTVQSDSTVAGIIGDLHGIAEIRECRNDGDLSVLTPTNSYGSVSNNSVVGGIVGKNQVPYGFYGRPNNPNLQVTNEENKIFAYDCVNNGNIKSSNHCGGIIGLSTASEIKLENCINQDNTIHAISGDDGGMIGYAAVNKVTINNCITKNTTFSNEGANTSYGLTGGIVGHLYTEGYNSKPNKDLVISNCNVLDCLITSYNKGTAGILGGMYENSGSSNINKILITDCNVERCTIKSIEAKNESDSAGVLGCTYGSVDIKIKNCNISDSYVASLVKSGENGRNINSGGIVGMSFYAKTMELSNCKVNTSEIYNNAPMDSNANTSGIIGGFGGNDISIDNCDVVNSSVQALSGNLGGTIGFGYNSNITIKNCDNEGIALYSTSTTSVQSTTGGIVGVANISNRLCEIENCSVKGNENSKVAIYGRGCNVSGILSCCMGQTSINNVEVKDIIIESDGANFYGNTTISGIAGYSANKPTISNCLVENAEITGLVNNATGVLGCSNNWEATTFENIIVKNSQITNKMTSVTGGTNSIVAGITGALFANNEYKNCKVENCKITGSGNLTSGMFGFSYGGTFNKCEIKDTVIKRIPGDIQKGSKNLSIAGIIGSSPDSRNDFSMTECSVQNVEISGDVPSIGGIAGYVTKVKEFANNTVKGLTITGTSQRNTEEMGSIAGMIGDWIYKSSDPETEINNCDITNFTAESGSNNLGGIVGTVSGNEKTVKFKDCDLDNLNLKYTNTVKYNVIKERVLDWEEKYTKIVCNRTFPRCIGGLVAIGGNEIKVSATNCTSKNSEYTALDGNNGNINSSVGSFIGWTKDAEFNSSTITNNKLNNYTVEGMTGGLIGATQGAGALNNDITEGWKEGYGTLKVDNAVVDALEITSNNMAGGIAGLTFNADLSNCSIANTAIQGNGTNIRTVIGIVLGNDNSESGCTVDEETVQINSDLVETVDLYDEDEDSDSDVVSDETEIITDIIQPEASKEDQNESEEADGEKTDDEKTNEDDGDNTNEDALEPKQEALEPENSSEDDESDDDKSSSSDDKNKKEDALKPEQDDEDEEVSEDKTSSSDDNSPKEDIKLEPAIIPEEEKEEEETSE